jgi:DNA-binding MarR family transcriptional regulator
MTSTEEIILDNILELQKANRNISEQQLANNIILVLLEQNKELTLSQLLKFLNCPQAYLTHLLKRMEGAKLVSVRQASNDLRFRYFSLTKKGQEEVSALDKHYDSVLKSREKNFSKNESETLALYFKAICDAGGITSQAKRKTEHVIRPQQRRLAALLGVTGRQILSLKVSSTNFHVLRLVYRQNGLLTLKNIADELNIQPSQVSALIKQFQTQKLIQVKPNPYDERSTLILLGKKGEQEYKKYWQGLLKIMAEYLKELGETEQQNFADLFTKFMNLAEEVVEIPTSEFTSCRTQMIEYSYIHQTLADLPSTIAGPSCRIFAHIGNNNERLAFAQFDKTQGAINLLTWKPGLALSHVQKLLAISVTTTEAKPVLSAKQQEIFTNLAK